jgi:hypothetical protein
MTQPEIVATRPRSTPAIWVGLALGAAALAWWLFYYSQYGGWFEQLGFKAPCLAVTTDDCLLMQKKLVLSAVPAYHPVLFWAGTIVLVIGVFQRRSRRA